MAERRTSAGPFSGSSLLGNFFTELAAKHN
jgi:hypothetical protein